MPAAFRRNAAGVYAPDRRIVRPRDHVRELARWRRTLPLRNAGKLQRASSGKVIRTSDTHKARRSSGAPCDCECVTEDFIQWRKCSDDSLQDLWSPKHYTDGTDPLTGEPFEFPYGMILRADGNCYYHDEGDPVSTTPGTIVYPVTPPTYSDGDFVFLPSGWACTDAYCSPHECLITCDLGVTPRVILLEFSGITLPWLGCVDCPGGSGCLAEGFSYDSAGDATKFNRRFLCFWYTDEGCCYSAFGGIGKREEVYSETYHDWLGCGSPPPDLCGGVPCCTSDPFDLWFDSHDVGFPGTYWDASVCLDPDAFAVSITQSQGGPTIYFFSALIPFASEARCDLPVTGSNGDGDTGIDFGGPCDAGTNRGSGGTVNVVPLL